MSGPLSFFNCQSNVAFDERIVNVDLHELSSSMRVFGMLTALEAVRTACTRTTTRRDDVALHRRGAVTLRASSDHRVLHEVLAEGRKFNLIATGITQNSTYMLAHEDARNMVLNSDFVLLHKQSALDRKSWVDLLSLSATEAGYIDDTIKAGEGLLVAAGCGSPSATTSRRARSTTCSTRKPPRSPR